MNSKISLFLGSVAIAAKKLYSCPVEGRMVAHAKDIMLVHEHQLGLTTMNDCCNTCGIMYCQLCGKSLIPGATQNHEIVCMAK